MVWGQSDYDVYEKFDFLTHSPAYAYKRGVAKNFLKRR